jgi:hypothetical protein
MRWASPGSVIQCRGISVHMLVSFMISKASMVAASDIVVIK